MKMIISPSKTYQKFPQDIPFDPPLFGDLLFTEKTKGILDYLKRLSKTEIASIMKIKGELLEETFENISTHETQHEAQAIVHYTGFVYKKLELANYQQQEWAYLDKHLSILSAFYGVLHPFHRVKPYRLDLTMKLPNFQNLVSYWKESVNDHFKNEDTIINLASHEFSRLITRPMVTIDFLERREGRLVNLATYAKQARGLMLNYLIQHKITTIEGIKHFCEEEYQFDPKHSNDERLVFTRSGRRTR